MDAFTFKPVHSLLNKSNPFSDGFGPMIRDEPASRAMALNWPCAGFLTLIRLATPFLSATTGRPRQNTFRLDRPSRRSSQQNRQAAAGADSWQCKTTRRITDV